MLDEEVMNQLDTIAEGKDRVSGHIRRFQRVPRYEDSQESDLRVFLLLLDSGVEVYLHSTQAYFEEILKRADRPATFAGEFVDSTHKKMICEAVVFWNIEGET
jgi:hypothetical protein